MYAVESLNLGHHEVKSLDRCVKQALGKIFSTYDNSNLEFIMQCFNIEKTDLVIVKKKCKFFRCNFTSCFILNHLLDELCHV